jgi:CheY-like chemotaxis protein
MAMTASVMAGDRQRMLDAGFDAFQSKTITLRDFLVAVEQLLERHRR